MAKSDNLTDFLTDVADAIRAKKGTTSKINPQNFAEEIATIESGGNAQRVMYLRRNNGGYIDTGVDGANDNLKITVRYALRTFPTGYWRFITAYENESTNTTRIIFNKNTQVLGNVNSVATGGSATLSRTTYAGVIYTDTVEPASSTSFKLSSNNLSVTNKRVAGNDLTKTISIFPEATDTVDIELYHCQIYDGSTLVRNFIPYNKDGEYGLWDTVTQQFYGNVGDGGEFSGEMVTIED